MDKTNQEKNMQPVNDEQLDQVAGGDAYGDGYRFYGHVGKYDGVVGQYYYVVKDSDHDIWFWGELLRTWEDSTLWWTTRRHKFHIVKTCDGPADFTDSFSGDDYTLYLGQENA